MHSGPKILIIRFSSIGDIVLTTPVIRCIKKQIPDVELHYITKSQYEELLQENPYVDKIHFLKDSIWDTIQMLKKEDYDYIIDLHHNQRTFLIKTFLGVKSYSFYKMNFEKWLMVNFKINKLQSKHIVDRYLDTVQSLGVDENDGQGLDYFLPDEFKTLPDELPESHQSNFVAFAIGARQRTKQFPVHKVIEVCKNIELPIILLGGKMDTERGTQIQQEAGDKVFNGCGKFSLSQSASIIKQAKKVITNDTGMMHIAAAFQKPILSLWGNTIPEFGMSPYYGNTEQQAEIFEVKGLSCRPCSKLGYDKCPKGHFKCMENIDVKEVIAAANSIK